VAVSHTATPLTVTNSRLLVTVSEPLFLAAIFLPVAEVFRLTIEVFFPAKVFLLAKAVFLPAAEVFFR